MLVISDAHSGLKAAIAQGLSGTTLAAMHGALPAECVSSSVTQRQETGGRGHQIDL